MFFYSVAQIKLVVVVAVVVVVVVRCLCHGLRILKNLA